MYHAALHTHTKDRKLESSQAISGSLLAASTMAIKIIDFSKASPVPLNPLSAAVRQFIYEELQDGLRDPNITSMVLTGGTQHFSAGADLTEFGSFSSTSLQSRSSSSLTLVDVVQSLEDSTKPIVAAIAGTCLGGGLELALACHYRVALQSSTTKMGLPEVHVGVIPGAGGTQRLPKVVGLATACQMILTGSSLSAKAALKAKLIDDVAEDPRTFLDKAQKWALWAEVMPLGDRRLGQQKLVESAPLAHNIIQQAQLALPKTGAKGLEAALRALRASFYSLNDGMAVESQAFVETLTSEQGRARRHAFFAVRQAQKMMFPVLAKKIQQNVSNYPILRKQGSKSLSVAVIGAGTMGGGIAMVLLTAGFCVTLVDVKTAYLEKGIAGIQRTIDSQVKRKKIKPAAAKALLSRLGSTTRLEELGDCHLVVEAVVENLKTKQSIFRSLDKITAPNCILVSNTSTLDIDAMASVLSPERQKWFLGWHFFSPAHVSSCLLHCQLPQRCIYMSHTMISNPGFSRKVMKLVEIVRGSRTCPEAITVIQILSKKVGKIGVVVGNCDGFCGNRLLRPYTLESTVLVGEGAASIAEVDKACTDFGMALGPLTMGDLAGTDVGFNVRKERGWVRDAPSDAVPPKRPARYTELADTMITVLGRIGQKAGKGFYDYKPDVGKGRVPLHSEEMEAHVQSYLDKLSFADRSPKLAASEIVNHCFFSLVNEGFKCLEEGIVLRPSDIDVVYIYGYGWPAWRGGPMHWADHQVGLATVLSWLERKQKQHPRVDHFVPSALLVHCVKEGITVEEYYTLKERATPKSQMSKL